MIICTTCNNKKVEFIYENKSRNVCLYCLDDPTLASWRNLNNTYRYFDKQEQHWAWHNGIPKIHYCYFTNDWILKINYDNFSELVYYFDEYNVKHVHSLSWFDSIGLLHRENDEPAFVKFDYSGNVLNIEYCEHGILHRENKPARICFNTFGECTEFEYYNKGTLTSSSKSIGYIAVTYYTTKKNI
jgi:hypothetical protein